MVQLLLVGGSGGGGGGEGLTFTNYFPNDPAHGVYTDWAEFMAAVAEVPLGTAPTFTIATPGTPFVIPLAGMPVNGWDFRGGILRSFFPATGSVVLDVPTGVLLDNLWGIENSLGLHIAPAAGDSTLRFSGFPAGVPWFFRDGGYIRNSGAGSLIRSPGTEPGGTVTVYAAVGSQYASVNPPVPVGQKLVFISNDGGQEDDGLVITQQLTLGGIPNDSFQNNNTNCSLVLIYDSTANPDTDNLAVWQPALTVIPAFTFVQSKSAAIDYTPAVIADWSGVAPTSVANALDRIAAAIGPIP